MVRRTIVKRDITDATSIAPPAIDANQDWTASEELLALAHPYAQNDILNLSAIRKSKKKKPGKKLNNTKKSSAFTATRSVDSLFRNAYRTQLDMLALATAKANIMISLNGLLISILIVSGTHFVSMYEHYAMALGILLSSSSLAIIFAVLAARSDFSNKQLSPTDFETDKARLLVFDDFSSLSETDYSIAMTNMLGDQDRLYQNMISHLHYLGSMADRSFRKLYYSYTTFVTGIVITMFSIGLIEWKSYFLAV